MNVVFTTVVRATGPGEPHGRLYFADLESGRFVCAWEWDVEIDTSTRGGARGLRGVSWHRDRLWIAAYDRVLELSASLEGVGVHTHPALLHAHQLAPWGDRLLVVSTGADAVLALDTLRGEFDWGLRVRGHPRDPVVQSLDLDRPSLGDSTHLNMVYGDEQRITLSGTRLGVLIELQGSEATALDELPMGTHDARPTPEGLLYNDTERDRVVWGEQLFAVPRLHPSRLTHLSNADGMARQAFARGLVQVDAHTAIGGSSPASLHRYDRTTGLAETVLRTTTDVRESVHGLALWPHPLPEGKVRDTA